MEFPGDRAKSRSGMKPVPQRQFLAWAVAIGATTAPAAWLVAIAARYVLAEEPEPPRTILSALPYTSSLLAALFVAVLIAAGLLLRERSRLATLLGGMMILAVALSEGQAIKNSREHARLSLSMGLIRQAGQFIHGEFVGMGKPFPSAIPAHILHARDPWGRPLAYKQISPSVALVGSPTVPADVSEADSQFPPSDYLHELVVRVDERGPEFIVYPFGPASGDSCHLQSLFGCFGYW